MASHSTGPQLNNEKNRGTREWFSNLPVQPGPDFAIYYNDFLSEQEYAAADWTITTTEAGAGSATEARGSDEKFGSLLITNDDADNDVDSLQLVGESQSLDSDKRMWMEMRCKINDADQVDVMIGLGVTDTTPLATTDRLCFQIDDGDASILCKSEKDSTETSTDSGIDAVDDTYLQLGMYWDGKSSVTYYVDRAKVATHTTNIPDDEQMRVTLHIQNGEAAAQSMEIDYIYVCQER